MSILSETNNIEINQDQLYKFFGNSDVIVVYSMKFYNNFPINDLIHVTYNGKIYDMPSKINDIINMSPLFKVMMQLFRTYHENLDINDDNYDKKFSPIKLKIRIRREKDPFNLDYDFILDYNKLEQSIYV